ncbi:hypothetical protein LZ31DRAFT_441663, partial [Colletotrichum somersetense]
RTDKEQWAELVAQHVKLQHEYHAFFLTTLHTSAAPEIKRLAESNAMPARLWNSGIKSLMEL